MSDQQPEQPEDSSREDHDRLEAARREKLRKIAALGVDPWGGRFDDRTLVDAIRARSGEIRYVRELG
jgi:lysyl-tRNA synthetase class 2